MKKFIQVNEPLLSGNEKKYLNECIDSGMISSEGPFVRRFESEFAAKVGRKYAVAVSNGSVAIDAAVVALDIRAGDEVIMPTFTIISCIAQIYRIGAIPVLIDCDPLTWNLDITQLEQKISSRTKAIMVVHIYGLPVDMNPVLALAKKYGLKIVEDAAEMHGQTYFDRPCGSFGDISTFSFYPNKHVTTGEGGMIVTDDESIYNKCCSLRNLGFQANRRFVHEEIGWNLRMTNMQASIGVAQLERLDEFANIKRRMGHYYSEMLSDMQDYIQLPEIETAYARNIYWVFGVVLKDSVSFNAAEAMRRMAALNIGTRPFFYPMHLQPVFRNQGMFEGESHPIAERIAERGFYIPSGLALSDGDMLACVDALKSVLLNP